MKRIVGIMMVALFCHRASAQEKFPVQELQASTGKPFVFFVSGDGGLKGFTVSLCKAIRDKGYSIASLDARSYFWDKKTPEQTASDIAHYVAAALRSRTDRHWMMIGYSFGADITPFVVNRLPDSLKSGLSDVILLSPSTSTDFEIHLSDMLGIGKKRSTDVVAEINRLGNQQTVFLFGEDEHEFPVDRIKLPHYRTDTLKGGHHFGGDYQAVADRCFASLAMTSASLRSQ